MIAVLGAQGQVGRDLVALLSAQEEEFRAYSRSEADLSDPNSLVRVLDELEPSVVLNAGAYTAVDLAEKERDLAFKVNAEAPGVIAGWCAEHGARFVHYSTDYVFSGEGRAPWKETDPTGPLSVYGSSKLAGEKAVVAAGGRFLILRTSWVYSPAGKNFLNTMLRLGAEKEELGIVSDQVGAPTLSLHLAEATLKMIDHPKFESGLYHACNDGETSWHGFAGAIFEEAKRLGHSVRVKNLRAIPTDDYPTPARRPLNSRLDTSKLRTSFGLALPHWREALTTCMELRK